MSRRLRQRLESLLSAATRFPKLCALEAAPSPLKLPGILWTALRG